MLHVATPSVMSLDVQLQHVCVWASCGVTVLQKVVLYVGRAATAVWIIRAGHEPAGSSRSVVAAVSAWSARWLRGATAEPIAAVFE